MYTNTKMSTIATGLIAHQRRTTWIARTAALTFFAAATAIGLQAESNASQPTLDLRTSLAAPLDLAAMSYTTSEASSSSSASTTPEADALTAERLSLSSTGATQPPPRRYGRPRYNDSSHNADGSNKYAFEFGAGFTMPTGGSHNYLATSYKFQAGVGRNFNKNFALMAQFDWDNFGFQGNTLTTLLNTYNAEIAAYNAANPGNQISPLTQLGGNSHIWSFSLNPVYTFYQSDKSGAYVVGGVGFYHKTANFTVPTIQTACSYYYGCYQYQANQSIDKYTSNAPGFNGGIGFTYRPSRFASQKFFVEARYVFVDNQPRPFSEGSSTSTYYNVFPQNSARTTYIPVTIGLRF